MEFTKDDYVVEGKLKVYITIVDKHPPKSWLHGVTKVVFKSNWIILEHGNAGVSAIGSNSVVSIDIEEE